MGNSTIIPLFSTGQRGKSATVTAQRHLNIYAELNPDSEKGPLSFYGTPGLLLKTSFGDTPVRGWIAIGDLYYAVHRGTFYSVNNAGTKVILGTISTTSGRVDMTYDGTTILITTGTNGYTFNIGTATFGVIASATFPQTANTCAWLNGQFIVDNGIDDVFQISEDAITWAALDFATAETNPDGLVRVFVDNGELILAGGETLEFWGDIGGDDFPFQSIKGATTEYGLAARWSLCKFNSGVAGVLKNRAGQVQVMFIHGYIPKPLSSQELDSIINGYATVSDATAYGYMWGGHPMLQVNFPSAGASWLFDASTNLWSPLEYGLNGVRHRGEMHLDFLNKPLIADYSTGDIYELSATSFTDNGVAIPREIVGRHFFQGNERVVVDELYVDAEVGVGLVSGQGVDPQISLSVSKDNGKTWTPDMWTTLGAIGANKTRAAWRRLGVARNFTFKLRVTDPVKFVLTYAALRVRTA